MLKKACKRIIHFKKRKIKLFTIEQQESYEKTKIYYILREKLEDKYTNDKKYRKARDNWNYGGKYRGAARGICNFKYSVPNEITVNFHNRSNCNYHFIRKELSEEFEGQFTSLRKVTKKCINFSVLIEKEVKIIDKNGSEITKIISYKLKFTDRARFMASSLSKFINNLAEGIFKV